MRSPRAMPAAHLDRNESHVIYGTGHEQFAVKSMSPWAASETEALISLMSRIGPMRVLAQIVP
jgi:hypothetical protein